MIADGAGHIWFSTTGGISAHDGIAWSDLLLTDGPACNHINSMVADSKGALWVGSDTGVTRITGSDTTLTWRSYGEADGLPSAWVRRLAVDAGDDLWAATAGGVGRFDGNSWDAFTTADGLISNDLLSVAVDTSGRKWFGTNGDGVSQLDDRGTASHGDDVWTTYSTAQGLGDDIVIAIAAAPDGSVWLATLGGGLSHLDGGTWTTYTVADGLPSNDVTQVAVDRVGGIWIGTMAGAARFSAGVWTAYTVADGLPSGDIISVGLDRQGRAWFGTLAHGLYRLEDRGTPNKADDRWTDFTPTNALLQAQVRALTTGPGDILWVGAYGGGINRMTPPLIFFPMIPHK